MLEIGGLHGDSVDIRVGLRVEEVRRSFSAQKPPRYAQCLNKLIGMPVGSGDEEGMKRIRA